MGKIRGGILAAMMLSGGSGFSQNASSSPIRVDAVIETSFHWCTVKEANPKLNWAWPEGAKSARLTVTGGPAATNAVFNTPDVPECEWVVSLPAEDASECVYSFKLEFYPAPDCGGETITDATLLTEGVGAVRGVAGSPFRFVKTATDESAPFSKIPARNAVLPIPAGTTEFTIDGGVREIAGGPAYFAWQDIGTGDHEVTLSGTDLFVRDLERFPAGSIISIF